MRVPVGWLSEYCAPGLDSKELADVLAMSGTEVERIGHVGVPGGDGNPGLFRIGRVREVSPHPDADRLRVCSVELGEEDVRSIVCGAPNVAGGQAVLVALPGAVLPDGTKLRAAKLRGVESNGMILSESEVQLGTDSAGIMVLPDDTEAGGEAGAVVQLGDDVLELEVTPNRPDCLAVYGVARELHAVTGAPLAPEPWEDDAPTEGEGRAEDLIEVSVEDLELCPRFSVRVFTDVKVAPSPLWLKARLVAAGMRPISNVVDITNYVMLLAGQPMHAYDLDKIAGPALHVRRAREGEQLVTLDDELRVFDSDAVLVCDADGPTGIGGIMGGARSEVSSETTRVAMEAATWNGGNILQTSKKLGLRSEASTRFEKQLHPELALCAQRVAAKLMVELCGARMVPGTVDAAADPPPPARILLRTARVEKLLGQHIDPAESAQILGRLGFGVTQVNDDIEAEVPYFRAGDVEREADLIEEVARIHGLNQLPTTLPARRHAMGSLSPQQRLRREIEEVLRARGLDETVTYSFISPDASERLRISAGDARARVLRIANPLSEDQAAMRTTLLPGLLAVAAHNLARDAGDLRLFESGRVFLSNGSETLPDEPLHLAALLAGDREPASWQFPARPADFYAIKGIVEAVLGGLGVEWRLADGGPPFLHPGRSAQVLVGSHDAGWLGELHPMVVRDWDLGDLERPPVAMELDLEVVLPAALEAERRYEDLITYPAVFQDLAVVVEEPVEAQTVIDTVRAAAGPQLRSIEVFDLYRGEQVGEGNKSLALRLEFRSPDRTLTDEEVGQLREQIKDALARETGGSLRE